MRLSFTLEAEFALSEVPPAKRTAGAAMPFRCTTLLRRLQTGRVEPFGQMRGGIGPSCPEQQIIALAAGWKCLGFFTVCFGLVAKPFFQRDHLLETSSLHDALLSF
jgi:hypothetical protein